MAPQRFSLSAIFLVTCLQANTKAFQSSHQTKRSPNLQTKRPHRTYSALVGRHVAASVDEPYSDENINTGDFHETMSNITATCLESMSMETDDEEQAIQQQLDRRAALSSQTDGMFRAEFKLNAPIGISLAQVKKGRKISDVDLDLDQLQLESVPVGEVEGVTRQRMDWPTVAGRVETDFRGLLVSSVVQGSAAWDAGVRAGDVVSSISATLGGALWPTSTLDGIQSALRSRKITSSTVSMEFGRLTSASTVGGNRYQLSLQRPLGIEVQESDGCVVVTGFTATAPNLVRHAVQPGDRVVAVDSSFGSSLWPVTTVAGLTSACTSRLPGKPVTVQFERPLENMQSSPIEFATTVQGVELASPPSLETATQAAAVSAAEQQDSLIIDSELVVNSADKKALLRRCRDVLTRYSLTAESKKSSATATLADLFKDKHAVPAIVADKVVDSLASARVSLDSVTLSMIMRAYLSCNRPDSALRVFEAAVKFRADGSCLSVVESLIGGNGGGFVPNESALNLYTGTALLQAHAMKGDLFSVSRVLASLEGRSGVLVNGLESAPWPFTGEYGSIQPDVQCYNIAISAATKIGGEEGLEMALALFDTMGNSEKGASRAPVKDLVTYNTIISALTAAGRSNEAFRAFYRMKMSMIRPDKYTYTPLIKACESDGDIEELLYDMKENNVQGDTVTYNTMIRSLCEKRRWTEASRLVTEMEARGVPPDSRTYGNLMSAMLKAGKARACLTLFESACSASKTSVLTENVFLYTTAITAASVLGDYERAIELLSRMAAKGVKPNLKTLTSVAGACLAGGNAELAAQVYQKIETPDGYAMMQGVEALSKSGELQEAFEILQKQQSDRRNCVMTGKQVMKGYSNILVEALKVREFETAEAVLRDLLQRGNIPNRRMLFDITDALGFSETRGMVSFAVEDEEERAAVFRFMLFVLDSLQSRKLPVESNFYAVVLFMGRVFGGKARQVATLVAQSKVPEGQQRLIADSDGAQENAPSQLVVPSWVHLLDNIDQYELDALRSNSQLPIVPVRLKKRGRDVKRLVRAEQVVSFATTSSRRAKSRRQ